MSGVVDQTILATDPIRKGNCVSACVATILGVPLERVPHFVEYGLELGDEPDGKVSNGNAWWAMLLGYFYGAGLQLVELDSVEDAEHGDYLLVAGMSPRGVLHQVVYRDGALWHDPHPSRDGVLDVQEVLAVRPLGGFDHTPTGDKTRPGSWVTCATCGDRCDQPSPPNWWLGRHAHATGAVAFYRHWSGTAEQLHGAEL